MFSFVLQLGLKISRDLSQLLFFLPLPTPPPPLSEPVQLFFISKNVYVKKVTCFEFLACVYPVRPGKKICLRPLAYKHGVYTTSGTLKLILSRVLCCSKGKYTVPMRQHFLLPSHTLNIKALQYVPVPKNSVLRIRDPVPF